MTNRILLVEDDPDDAALTLRALRRANVANGIDHVRDGVAALEYLRAPDRDQPMLVLLDLKLPKLDGLQVLARMRADPRLRPIPW